MATGALPFRGETSAMICEAIVNRLPASPLFIRLKSRRENPSPNHVCLFSSS
jgi:hypothetical protein